MHPLRMITGKNCFYTNLILLLLIFCGYGCGTVDSFRRLSGPEKWWVVTHPFVAGPARKISAEAKDLSVKMEKDPRLDGDPDGGSVDAFRHAFWMARLSQRMKMKKALGLGRAHEKSNYRKFLKKEADEDGNVPDSVSTAMDLYNNTVGAEYGNAHRTTNKDTLILTLIGMIKGGKLKIISKSPDGRSLDCSGNALTPQQYKDKWRNDRCLIDSR